MADEFDSPTRRTTTTAYEPVIEPVVDPVTGQRVVTEVDEPVVYTETSYETAYSGTDDSYPADGTDRTDSSTADVAKEQAAQVGQGAADAGKHVAGVAQEQAASVASEAADQAKNLYEQTRQELRGQAATQQQRLAESVRSLGSELESMADRSNAGTASDLVREASGRARDVAGWLDQRDPGALLQEVTDFARRRPGTFLAIAAGAGLIAGRLTRGAISEARSDSGSSSAATGATTGPSFGTGPAPVAGTTGTPVAGYAPPTPEPAESAPYERYESVGVEETSYSETFPRDGYAATGRREDR
jgi:hypothetical protein